MFKSAKKPWSYSGGLPPEPVNIVIVSNTLAVFASGSNTEIELMNAFTTLTFGSTITPAQYTNNRVLATGNFTIEEPTGTSDGAIVNFWITGDGASPEVTLGDGIVIPSSSSVTSPFTVPIGTKTRIALQYDAEQNGGQWELVQYIPGY